MLVGWLVAFAALGILARRSLAGRAAVLAAPVALGTALFLRAIGIEEAAVVIAILAVATGVGSLLLALRPAFLVPAVVGFLAAFLVVLAVWPEVNALAAIGPHPDGGGRFYGVTNEVETLLLAPSLAAAAAAGVAGAVAIGLLLLVLVGWSRAGADGGGLLVVAAAFAVLLAGLTRVRLTPTRLALGIAACSRSGSRSSASTRCSAARVTSRTRSEAAPGRCSTTSTGGSGFRGPEPRRRRTRRSSASCRSEVSPGSASAAGERPAIVAMLVAIGVSLLVNDTPVDVLGYGALGCLALTAWAETRSETALSERTEASSRLPEPREHPAR